MIVTILAVARRARREREADRDRERERGVGSGTCSVEGPQKGPLTQQSHTKGGKPPE